MTPNADTPEAWLEAAHAVFLRYDDDLLRQVAAKLIRPRNQWPADELRDRCLQALTNPATLDRRLKELPAPALQALALLAQSHQPMWAFGHLVELLMALGCETPLTPLFALLETGLIFPVLPETGGSLRSFEQWLGFPGGMGLAVFTTPGVAERAAGTDLGLPDLSAPQEVSETSPALPDNPEPAALALPLRADGLEWLLRLAVLWQQVLAAPLRRTQQGAYFKRDQERLTLDGRLTGQGSDQLAELPDAGFLLAELAEQLGIVQESDGEIAADLLPAAWEDGLAGALASVWGALSRLRRWNPLDGWRAADDLPGGNPFVSAVHLAMLLLARIAPDAWVSPARVQVWIQRRHPFWKPESVRPSRLQPWLGNWLLGLAYPLGLVRVRKDTEGGWLVSATTLARWLLRQGPAPEPDPVFTQTLVVQPNLEILAYRQGLTPALIARMSKFATWKTLGPACTLQLEPETVYRALETGETFDSIKQALERHSTRELPASVVDLLRTWSNKRDRITVYPSAVLMEFASGADLEAALARGLQAIRIADHLALVASDDGIDYKHFKLTGSRDYGLAAEKCVTVESDGVTLTVDLARSDLILETELPRFADLIPGPASADRRQYRLSPASLRRGRDAGMTLPTLESWFQQRTGLPIPPAARLLLIGAEVPAPTLERSLVLHVPTAEIAEGLLQWPQTRGHIQARLGPTALVVAEENLPALRESLALLGIVLP
jgi:hypothetical protein